MNQEVVLGLLRHGLTALGGAFAASHPGWLGSSDVDAVVGALMTVAGVALSVLNKRGQP